MKLPEGAQSILKQKIQQNNMIPRQITVKRKAGRD